MSLCCMVTISVLVTLGVLFYLHLDGFKHIYRLWLRARRKKIILFHYTKPEDAESIYESGRFLTSQNERNENWCYFFIVGKKPISNHKFCNNIRDERKREAGIVVIGLSEAQIKACEYGMQRRSLMHKGDFVFCDENHVHKIIHASREDTAYCHLHHTLEQQESISPVTS